MEHLKILVTILIGKKKKLCECVKSFGGYKKLLFF